MGLCATVPEAVEGIPKMLQFQASEETLAAGGGLVCRSLYGHEIPVRNIAYDSKWIYFNINTDQCIVTVRSNT